MNTLSPNSIEHLRRRAIMEARARTAVGEREGDEIVLTEEFRDLFTNGLYPLGKDS